MGKWRPFSRGLIRAGNLGYSSERPVVAKHNINPVLDSSESKALRDDVQGSTNAVDAGAENRHPAPW